MKLWFDACGPRKEQSHQVGGRRLRRSTRPLYAAIPTSLSSFDGAGTAPLIVPSLNRTVLPSTDSIQGMMETRAVPSTVKQPTVSIHNRRSLERGRYSSAKPT